MKLNNYCAFPVQGVTFCMLHQILDFSTTMIAGLKAARCMDTYKAFVSFAVTVI